MIDRRRFLKTIAAAAVAPSSTGAASRSRLGPLVPDPDRLLDVPAGFSSRVVSRAGDVMSDGLRVPPAHDGMGAFAGDDGRIILVCNHEMVSSHPEHSAFGTGFAGLPEALKQKVYDRGGEITPGAGGTTTTVYDPRTGRTERQFMSLAGTELNCAGGTTPWGSWLSCEESFTDAGSAFASGRKFLRDERHGYVFEVPAAADEMVDAVPLRAMGRFEHEAAAVHAASGIVYLTEDRYHSLFYRFIPDVPGRLAEGGRLQALAIAGQPSFRTHNWGIRPDIGPEDSLPVEWIALDDVDALEDDLRSRGAALGAAMFARGEGLAAADDDLFFTCTIGGRARLGQVFRYTPSAHEGCSDEAGSPGRLHLVAEAREDSLLQNADNLTVAPWGDLVVCEDTLSHCGLIGVCPDGSQYAIADNPYSSSELAGVCFSPDGGTMFVNIQYPGATVAITGPWPSR